LRDASRKDERAIDLLPRTKALDEPIWDPCEQGPFSLVHAQKDVIPLEALPDVECRDGGGDKAPNPCRIVRYCPMEV
jgi:hypothetical protein